ncbi:hypothetical protein [Shimia abyssi]|uniref:Uncharacterized protein n=1 Tax=Shimia abyssi TaxID=1662395 RepID=A0A2P8FE40_9RHOB|nr:hypothetical protein [Shimia abyssi]PSL20000.1 hypothetical protein CLV88_10459 [Shimia abyssi]
MPKLIRLYVMQVVAGFGLSAIFVALLLWFNVGNLWHLVSAAQGGVLAVGLLWVFNGIVFAGVQFAISVMRMARDDNGSGGKRDATPVLTTETRPVSVRARAR